MARIHTDLHFIHRDDVPKALELLYEAGLIKTQQRDIHTHFVSSVRRSLPDEGGFLEVKSIY